MNTKDNQRSRLTKMLMREAFIKLMHEKQPTRITVREICEKAEINRSTFYLHYNEPNDVLKEIEDEAIQEAAQYLHSIGASAKGFDNVKQLIASFLRYVQRNDEKLHILLVENNDPHFRKKLVDFTMKTMVREFEIPLGPVMKDYTYRFAVRGSMELLMEWIRSDYAIPETTLCDMLYTLCEGSIRGMCARYQTQDIGK